MPIKIAVFIAAFCSSCALTAEPTAVTNKNKPHPSKTTYQKPGAPIRILSPDFVHIEPGTTTRVDALFAAPKEGTMRIGIKPKDGIALTDYQTDSLFDLAAQTVELSFSVTAQEPGQYYVMFHAEYRHGKQQSERVFGIPIYVGDAEPLMQKAHPDYIDMPADEVIRTKKQPKEE